MGVPIRRSRPASLLFSVVALLAGNSWAGGNRGCLVPSLLFQSDFAIEKIYPRVNVEIGVVNRGSKAFLLWRQKTSPHVPDEAFNAHYYTPEQKLLAAKYGVAEPVDRVAEADLALSSAARKQVADFYASGARAYEYKYGWEFSGEPSPATRASWRAGSARGLLERMKLDPRLTEEKWKRVVSGEFEGRYFILADGRTFVVSQSETQALNAALDTHLYHAGLADLIFPEIATKRVDVIDMGTIVKGPDPGSFRVYSNSYDFRKDRVFDTRRFFLEMKPE